MAISEFFNIRQNISAAQWTKTIFLNFFWKGTIQGDTKLHYHFSFYFTMFIFITKTTNSKKPANSYIKWPLVDVFTKKITKKRCESF